jgi:DNA-binding MarR family transcriptional regulator
MSRDPTLATPIAEYPGGYVRTEFKLMAELRCQAPDIGKSDIAKRLGVSYQTVRMWLMRPEYQRYENWVIRQVYDALPLEERALRADVTETFQTFASEMQERLLHIVETTEDEKLQAAIAHDWLDRSGHSAVKKTDNRSFTFVLTPEAAAMLAQRAAEIETGRIDSIEESI